VDGANCHGCDIYPENSPLGLYVSVTAPYCKVNGIYSHTCSVANIQVDASSCEISGMRLDTSGTGIVSGGLFNRFSDGTINLASGAKGIQLNNGTNVVLRGITVDSTNAANGIGLVSKTALNNCWIQIHMYGGAKGFDFDEVGGSIGSNNYMWLTTDGGTTDAIDLPPFNSTNRIWLNGVLQSSP
jgi:hypothetical protein